MQSAVQSLVRIILFLAFSGTCFAYPTVPVPNTLELPYTYTGNPETRDVPFLAWSRDLSGDNYVEQEILMSGMAETYSYLDDVGQKPYVQSNNDPSPYVTRVLIRRPQNPEDFNGVVYLEILNATARYDNAPMWNLTYPSIIEDGAAWVGVTYSDTSARFMRDTWGKNSFPAPEGSKPRNRSRYAFLNITTRAHTWDMLNQAAALLKADSDARNPMRGFGVDTIIASGYSQSAAYTTTYANSFFPSYPTDCTWVPPQDPEDEVDRCEPLVDGYIVAAGGPTARLLNGAGSHTLGDLRNCENAVNRTAPCLDMIDDTDGTIDPTVPKIVRFTTESDIKAVRVRQTMADQPSLRTYEAAGTSHVDYPGNVVNRIELLYQFGVFVPPANAACDRWMNPISTGIPLSAIQHRLARWIRFDETPPPSHFIDFEGSFDDASQAWIRDGDDNVIGGVRPVRMGVPLGSYYGSNTYSGPLPAVADILCKGIIGGYVPFSEDEVRSRYPNLDTYLTKIWWNAWLSYQEGFLLPVDGTRILEDARKFEALNNTPD